MILPTGRYRTEAGSTVKLSGLGGGISRVSFDWLEEPDACCDCSVDPYPEYWGDGEWRLYWECDHCDGGSAPLHPDPQ